MLGNVPRGNWRLFEPRLKNSGYTFWEKRNILDVKNLGMVGENLQNALQYTLHRDQYYSALNKQDSSDTFIGFYNCANKHQVVIYQFVRCS
jgi:hypothetical protein